MLVVRCQIRISGVTRCSHRCVFYVLQLQPIIVDILDSRICNNLVVSEITSGSLRVTRPTAVLLLHLQVAMQGSRTIHKMTICMHDERAAFVLDYFSVSHSDSSEFGTRCHLTDDLAYLSCLIEFAALNRLVYLPRTLSFACHGYREQLLSLD